MTDYIRYGKWLIEVTTAKPAGWNFTVKLDLVRPSDNQMEPIDIPVGLFLDRDEGVSCCFLPIEFCFAEQKRVIAEAAKQYLRVRKDVPAFVQMLEWAGVQTDEDLDLDR